MEDGVQVVTVRGKHFFVCNYTGALIEQRFFIPDGPGLTQKKGCFVTLPVMMRWLEEKEGQNSKEFERLKHNAEVYFLQPDIIPQTTLPIERVPLGNAELLEYLHEIDLGGAWLRVDGAETVEQYFAPAPKKRKQKK